MNKIPQDMEDRCTYCDTIQIILLDIVRLLLAMERNGALFYDKQIVNQQWAEQFERALNYYKTVRSNIENIERMCDKVEVNK